MEQFLTEHGGVIVSAIVSLVSIGIIVTVITVVSHMDAYSLSSIVGG